MEQKTKLLYEFGPFRLVPEESLLYREGKPVYLKPKVFETLLVLVESGGRILDKETLMKRLWQDTFVEEANLAVNISQLRKALGQGDDGRQFIETVPRRGYRFAAQVREVWTEEPALVIKEYTSSRITIEEEEGESIDADAVSSPAIAQPRYIEEVKQTVGGKTFLKKSAMAVALAIALAGIAIGTYTLFFRKAERFQNLVVSRLPNTGNYINAAISPDGKYIAHSVWQSDQTSLRLRQIDTTGDVELIPPANVVYTDIKFSRDGSYIYYIASGNTKIETKETAIYKIPALGGFPIKIIKDISGAFSLSPDGERIAFTRANTLFAANEDGSDETTILALPAESNISRLAWSPDGEVIAFATWEGRVMKDFKLSEVRVDTKAERQISSQLWRNVYGLEWIADNSGLIMAASGQQETSLWHISYPEGEARTITNDSNAYHTISMTADSGILVSRINNSSRDIWIVADGDSANAQKITTGAAKYIYPVWTPDGQIVYVSGASGNNDIWIMQADGTNQRQLTTHDSIDTEPHVSPDGNYIVFSSGRAGATNIWRMEMDGSSPMQLTRGKQDRFPRFSPDGKWVVYTSSSDEATLWRVPIDGGEPAQLTREYSARPAISPDGKLIACIWKDKKPDLPLRLAIIPFEGGRPVETLDIPIGANWNITWANDGRSIIYKSNADFELWTQPIDGGPAKRLTDFKEAHIDSFDLSPDGNKLVCSRPINAYSLALIKDSK